VAVNYDPQDHANWEFALSNLGVVAIVILAVAGTIFVAVGTILTISISYHWIRAALSP
jgi:predicted anti-sigma-YlaC factor YlaD